MLFSEKLLRWYKEYGRDLPWRRTEDPYRIWLSEIILQQTRIEQGMDYWYRFVEKYPTVGALAEASEEEVLKLWQGLGYYSRARNLHAAARYIHNELKDMFPNTYKEILGLKGVGRYTAAAIASFAYRLPYPVIDGNVYRLVARLRGIDTPIGTDKAYGEFEAVLRNLMDRERPDLFNQAMMDFGSMQCKPVGSNCEVCVFRDECVAYEKGKVHLLPVKGASVKVRDRYFYYFDVQWTEEGEIMTLLKQRKEKDIWKGLYEFPMVESERALVEEEILREGERLMMEISTEAAEGMRVGDEMRHKLSHQTIHASFVRVNLRNGDRLNGEKWQKMTVEEAKSKPISRLIDRYLKKKDATSF